MNEVVMPIVYAESLLIGGYWLAKRDNGAERADPAWVETVGRLPKPILAAVAAVGLVLFGIGFDAWIRRIVVPKLAVGGVEAVGFVVVFVFQAGFGLSVGRHLTDDDYSAVRP